MRGPVATLTTAIAFLAAMAGPAPVFAEIVPRFEARAPFECPEIRAKPSPAEAAALIRCRGESITEGEVNLLENLRVQIGGGTTYNPRDHAFLTGIDPSAQLFPLRGSYKSYRCIRIKDSESGKNCVTVTQTAATGFCWVTTFGTWDCLLTGGSNEIVQNQPPPS